MLGYREAAMIPSAKAELATGTIAVATTASYSWAADIFPVISEIGVIAGTIVAVHGLGKLIYGYYKLWKNKDS